MPTDPTPILIQGDARRLPLADASVDLIVTSPPYWSLRSYRDGGQHYAGQIGSEPTATEYLDALIECTREWMRVLKPSGSIWVNLGDSYATGSTTWQVPAKSLRLLPHRYAIRCMDELGLIVRQDQVWAKSNSLPESVTDRTRRSHEYLFHMVKQSRYYSAVDEIRQPHVKANAGRLSSGRGFDSASRIERGKGQDISHRDGNPLGSLPVSVWEIPSQALNVPDHVAHARCCDGRKREGCEDGIDHYAAWPFALVRPIILGWSPREVCTACGEGRRLLTDRKLVKTRGNAARSVRDLVADRSSNGTAYTHSGGVYGRYDVTITGYVCACSNTATPSTPGVVVDPFGGTGAAPLVAVMAGRTGISVDASWDYTDVIARWRVNDPKERARAAGLDPDAVARVTSVDDRQGSLLDLLIPVP